MSFVSVLNGGRVRVCDFVLALPGKLVRFVCRLLTTAAFGFCVGACGGSVTDSSIDSLACEADRVSKTYV